jgi:hypothetical protein
MIDTEKILNMIDLNPRDFENVHGYLNMVELSVFENLAKTDLKQSGMFTLGAEHKIELTKHFEEENAKN